MSNLRQQIRSSIQSFIKQHDGEHVPVDILRVVQQEAMLLKETKEVHDTFLSYDPFQILKNNEMARSLLEPFVNSLSVVDCSRQRVGHDYCRIDAVVEAAASAAMPSGGNATLTFRYVRQPRKDNTNAGDDDNDGVGNDDGDDTEIKKTSSSNSRKSQPCHVWYSIEVSYGPDRPKENLLVVEIFAPKSVPTLDRPPVCINNDGDGDDDEDEDEEGGWEDIDDEDQDQNGGQEGTPSPSSKSSKRRKLSTGGIKDDGNDNNEPQEEDGDGAGAGAMLGSTSTSPSGLPTTHDSYIAYLDPDLLHEFVAMNFGAIGKQHSSINEATVFFILMTFPFYEHEWDIVGMVLDEVFGHEDNDDGDDSGDDE